jgi:hypothetical protein
MFKIFLEKHYYGVAGQIGSSASLSFSFLNFWLVMSVLEFFIVKALQRRDFI